MSPCAGWEIPAHTQEFLLGSDLVISKGDANYRRLLGDRKWDYPIPFKDVLCYFPAPIMAFRVMKSEVAVGIPDAIVQQRNVLDPGWMTNGQYGMFQFFSGPSKRK